MRINNSTNTFIVGQRILDSCTDFKSRQKPNGETSPIKKSTHRKDFKKYLDFRQETGTINYRLIKFLCNELSWLNYY